MTLHHNITAQTLPASLIQADAGAFVQRQSLIDLQERLQARRGCTVIALVDDPRPPVPMTLDRIGCPVTFHKQMIRFAASIHNRDRQELTWDQYFRAMVEEASRAEELECYQEDPDGFMYAAQRAITRVWLHPENFLHVYDFREQGPIQTKLNELGITDPRERQRMGAALGNTMRGPIRPKTLAQIEEAIRTYRGDLSKAAFARHSGLHLNTVCKHWDRIEALFQGYQTEPTVHIPGPLHNSSTGDSYRKHPESMGRDWDACIQAIPEAELEEFLDQECREKVRARHWDAALKRRCERRVGEFVEFWIEADLPEQSPEEFEREVQAMKQEWRKELGRPAPEPVVEPVAEPVVKIRLKPSAVDFDAELDYLRVGKQPQRREYRSGRKPRSRKQRLAQRIWVMRQEEKRTLH